AAAVHTHVEGTAAGRREAGDTHLQAAALADDHAQARLRAAAAPVVVGERGRAGRGDLQDGVEVGGGERYHHLLAGLHRDVEVDVPTGCELAVLLEQGPRRLPGLLRGGPGGASGTGAPDRDGPEEGKETELELHRV